MDDDVAAKGSRPGRMRRALHQWSPFMGGFVAMLLFGLFVAPAVQKVLAKLANGQPLLIEHTPDETLAVALGESRQKLQEEREKYAALLLENDELLAVAKDSLDAAYEERDAAVHEKHSLKSMLDATQTRMLACRVPRGSDPADPDAEFTYTRPARTHGTYTCTYTRTQACKHARARTLTHAHAHAHARCTSA